MLCEWQQKEKQIGTRLWRVCNTRLLSLPVNLRARESHEVIKLFHEYEFRRVKKNQKGREIGGDEMKGNCTSLGWHCGEGNGTHSSTLAWKIPWTEEPGRLQSMGSLRVRHDWATSLSLFTFIHWRRKWQPTPVFLPGESQGQGSLVGCHLWSHRESDTTEAT